MILLDVHKYIQPLKISREKKHKVIWTQEKWQVICHASNNMLQFWKIYWYPVSLWLVFPTWCSHFPNRKPVKAVTKKVGWFHYLLNTESLRLSLISSMTQLTSSKWMQRVFLSLSGLSRMQETKVFKECVMENGKHTEYGPHFQLNIVE